MVALHHAASLVAQQQQRLASVPWEYVGQVQHSNGQSVVIEPAEQFKLRTNMLQRSELNTCLLARNLGWVHTLPRVAGHCGHKVMGRGG